MWYLFFSASLIPLSTRPHWFIQCQKNQVYKLTRFFFCCTWDVDISIVVFSKYCLIIIIETETSWLNQPRCIKLTLPSYLRQIMYQIVRQCGFCINKTVDRTNITLTLSINCYVIDMTMNVLHIVLHLLNILYILSNLFVRWVSISVTYRWLGMTWQSRTVKKAFVAKPEILVQFQELMWWKGRTDLLQLSSVLQRCPMATQHKWIISHYYFLISRILLALNLTIRYQENQNLHDGN